MVWALSCDLIAQKDQKKSRYQSLSERNISTEQSVPALLIEAEKLIDIDPTLALDRVEQALATSITQKSTYNEAKCYMVLGKINESIGELELANQNYQEAYLRLQKAYRTTADFGQALERLGQVNYDLGRYEDSKRYYREYLRLKNIDSEKRAEVKLKQAENDVVLGNSLQALEQVNSLEPTPSFKKSDKLQSKGRAIKARAYVQQEDYESAEESLLSKESDADGAGEADFNTEVLEEVVMEDEEVEELLNIYQQQNKQEEEIALREKIAESKADANLPLQATKQRQAIGKVLIEQGRTNDAIRQLEQAAVLADSSGNYETQADAYLALADAYKKARSASSAIEAYEKHSAAMKDLLQERQAQRSFRENLLKKQQEIQTLTKDLALDESSYLLEETAAELQEQQLNAQRIWIYGLTSLLVIVLVAAYWIYRNAQKTKRVGQLLALKSLRTQMNPHFIFNALNSVNQFVALNDEKAANKFLADFSKLMRMVLDNSQREFITMREEQEMIALYLKLEHYRFRDQFEYAFEVDPSLDLDEIEIPPMLIQPYIENAIWHGLRYKKDKGHLQVSVFQNGAGIKVSVEDNGIGRAESARLKTANQKKKNSVGLKNTEERIAIINQVYRTQYQINITDLTGNEPGTRVDIITPNYHG